jgi:hypothetical protein
MLSVGDERIRGCKQSLCCCISLATSAHFPPTRKYRDFDLPHPGLIPLIPKYSLREGHYTFSSRAPSSFPFRPRVSVAVAAGNGGDGGGGGHSGISDVGGERIQGCKQSLCCTVSRTTSAHIRPTRKYCDVNLSLPSILI